MKINIGAYNEHYHQSGKFIDNWQEGIKLLPFNSTPASAYDKSVVCMVLQVSSSVCGIMMGQCLLRILRSQQLNLLRNI